MSADDDETPRRELDRVYLNRLQHLEDRMDNLQEKIREELHELEQQTQAQWQETRSMINGVTRSVQRVLDRQQAQQPAMDSMSAILNASMAIRWIIIAVVSTFAAVGTTATAIEIIKRWVK